MHLTLADALRDDVLVADRLDGSPLTLDNGAPLRIVAPAHYGYKGAKHLGAIEVCADRPAGLRVFPGVREHPRGRVALEERGTGLPQPLLRVLYRAAIRPARWYFRRAARRLRA